MTRPRIYLLAGILLRSVAAAADQPPEVDLPVPESPAFTALGVTPAKVARPSSGKDLAASLLNGVDSNGNLQTGFAIDMIPYLLAAQSHLRISEYRSSYLTRFIARASLSFGMVKGVTDDKSSHFATGLRLSLFDRGDPRADAALDACF